VVGIIPVVVLTIVRQNLKLSQNLKSAQEFNSNLNREKDVREDERICLIADNEKDRFETGLSNLIYIESTGNYIEIFYVLDDKLKNTLLRSTLKRTGEQLQQYTSIVKCHRAFLVNIDKIRLVKGNSQGLRLALINTETEIPVSRNYTKDLKDKFNSGL
jgi:DNA-binding LytR/AlgR family response regulator